ncbi:phosphotransferase [Paenibacillus sp. LS1]|uniref:phosphotransferase enzyme family protein n=1 Tax=Paenibacillus sp. LS1 TaxID=2992120 RepID=UPI00222E781A|nr:phosphotransferase [Paenibacillus sp. LS1]MCW3795182.1 phosphotransferase [Paenibacillus sp. LS1]
MLKLKYLFQHHDLAEMILKNWNYDPESLDMFQYYRISSNAVYPFRDQGEVRLIRFAPVEEKNQVNLSAELAFLRYLRTNHYGAMEAVPSHSGTELVETHTPWGTYYASVFKRVPGSQLGNIDLNDVILHSYGQALGELHHLSRTFTPEQGEKRWTYTDVLNWMQEILKEFPTETAALNEVKFLQTYFATWPMNQQNFGLIHYDFELDNVFYEEDSQSCYAIDFDDSMYHWYAMDVEQSLDSLREEIQPEQWEQKKQLFLNGYWSKAGERYDLESMFPACRRFANLYGYVRILRSASEQWLHEPEWMSGLRVRLSKKMTEQAEQFGKVFNS